MPHGSGERPPIEEEMVAEEIEAMQKELELDDMMGYYYDYD